MRVSTIVSLAGRFNVGPGAYTKIVRMETADGPVYRAFNGAAVLLDIPYHSIIAIHYST